MIFPDSGEAMLTVLLVLVAVTFWSFACSRESLGQLLVGRLKGFISQLTGVRMVFMIGVVAGVLALIHVLRGDGAMIAASGLGEGASWFVAFDVGTYLDVIAAVWLLSAFRYVCCGAKYAAHLVMRIFARSREPV
jgi:hypothetical protein